MDDIEILPDESAKASRDLSSSKIFSLQNAGWKAKQYGGARIKHIGAAGNLLFCATDRGRVIRWNLHTGDEQASCRVMNRPTRKPCYDITRPILQTSRD